MKLYTEEQLKEAIKIGYRNFFANEQELIDLSNEKIKEFTPVRMPSDEQIEEELPPCLGGSRSQPTRRVPPARQYAEIWRGMHR